MAAPVQTVSRKAGGNCGRCSKPMPTTIRKVEKGSTISFHMNGTTMPAFFVGAEDLDLQFCVRCKTHTPLLPVQSQ